MSIRPTAAMDVSAKEGIGVARRPRVCLVSERMAPGADEGIRKMAASLVQALGRRGPVLGVAVGSSGNARHTVNVKANRFFFSADLFTEVRAFGPDILCYVPTASDTVASFVRLKVLGVAQPHAARVLVSLQPRSQGPVGRWVRRRLSPDVLFVQSRARAEDLAQAGHTTRWLPSGVDLERFRPAPLQVKRALRGKYRLPQDAFLVLHVGHVTRERNVAFFKEVQRQWQVVIVHGGSVGQDVHVRSELEQAGIIVIDRHLDAIEEVYQASDCYVFPVVSPQGSIEAPLTVLEAMACNLPVVTTPFGGLPDLIHSAMSDAPEGFLVAKGVHQIPGLIARVQAGVPCQTRALAQAYSWEAVADYLVKESAKIHSQRRTKNGRS